MKPNLAFHSPTSEARYHILRCLSDCNEHSVAALKQFANEHMSEKMRTLCTRGVFSGIFTRLLENGYVVSPRRGFYQITSSGLFYFQNISVASPSAPAEADTASSQGRALFPYQPRISKPYPRVTSPYSFILHWGSPTML